MNRKATEGKPPGGELIRVEDEGADRKYYVMVPQVVWAGSLSPHDLALWIVIKMIAGEDGECYLGTRKLAQMAMMSLGQVAKSRKQLLAAGLLEGEIRQDPGHDNPVWHIRIPDLWRRNLEWREEHATFESRLSCKPEQKGGVHPMNTPPCSPHEQGCSPHERKNIQTRTTLHDDDDDIMHDHAQAIQALQERGWNAGEVAAERFIETHGGPSYMVVICAHARKHNLKAGWVVKHAGTWKPSKSAPNNGDVAEDRRRYLTPEQQEEMTALAREKPHP